MSTAHSRDVGAAGWLSLAAAPTFAAMALWTSVPGGDRLDTLCSAAPGGWPLSGTVVMYLLMAAFHSAPWLRLMSPPQPGDNREMNP